MQSDEQLKQLIKEAGLTCLAKALGTTDLDFPTKWEDGEVQPSKDQCSRLEVTHRHFTTIRDNKGLQTARAWLYDTAWLIAADRFEEVRTSAVRLLAHSMSPIRHLN